MQRKLTGRTYHKPTLIGLVLYVEHMIYRSEFVGDDSPPVTVWSKAKTEDLVNLNETTG